MKCSNFTLAYQTMDIKYIFQLHVLSIGKFKQFSPIIAYCKYWQVLMVTTHHIDLLFQYVLHSPVWMAGTVTGKVCMVDLFSDEHAKLCHGANCSFDHNLLVIIQVCGLLQEYRCRRGE